MEILSIILLGIYVFGVIAWLINWSHACSFLKEPQALCFFLWPKAFFPDQFKPEGNRYRKKSLIYLLVQAIPIIIFIKIQ